MAVTEPIRSKQQVNELASYYLKKGEPHNYVLVVMSVQTALRISDLLRLRWDDVYDFKHRRIRDTVVLQEQKTGKNKIIALNKSIVKALKRYSTSAKPGAFLLLNKRTGKAISRIQAYRIIRAGAEALQFRNRVSCHSLRKTFGYHAWKMGVSPTVIMEIYNHSSYSVTRRYLGVTQDDENKVYLRMELIA